jgi:hypothetical protein
MGTAGDVLAGPQWGRILHPLDIEVVCVIYII